MKRITAGLLMVLMSGVLHAASADTVTGRFTTVTLDGVMAEWSPSSLFYNDAEIADGLPLSSTYSNIYLANDSTYLYFGLQLKAPSSILSNWTHEVYIDTDNNPATGFNSGWMSGGYDRLIQYGSGGAVYSVYEFTGGGSQGSWSWGFLGTFTYGFNNEIIEWAIPRSMLGGATEPRVLLRTSGGDVSVETWAMSFESGAKNYQMAVAPRFTFEVKSLRGTPNPAVGIHTNDGGTVITNRVATPAPANGTQFVAVGWTMAGNIPLSGGATNFVMTLTNHSVLTWLWQTNVQLAANAGAHGSVSGDANGYYARGAPVTLTATPDAGYVFKGWSGAVPVVQTNDNPLILTLDQARNVTANFGAFAGRFGARTLDGSLAEWSPADLFYSDAEIADGEPLSSTYSAVYVANDHANLYVGLKLKAPSSIASNWLHSLYIDTDLNPATGFNAGWMQNGYNRMVQYGGGGGSYTIFEFTGAGQGDWSWNSLGTIDYAFDGDVIEWAIPRSALGGSTAAKLEFLTEGGAVTVATWAEQVESKAKIYSFGATPTYTVTVVSARGTATPSAGAHAYAYGTVLTNRVATPAPANGTQFVANGWALTGNEPASGAGTNFAMTVTNSATLTWLWTTNVSFVSAATAGGTVGGDPTGYYPLGTVVNLTATPNAGYEFAGWSGAVPAAQTNDNPLALTLDQARTATANFTLNYGRFVSITMDGVLTDWEPGDVFYTDPEITDGAPLNSTYSSISVANDNEKLYIGMQLKGVSSINSNWLHELYIDTDNNPATGFNAGWMSGGYDRLVQYGSGGGVYSVYEFTGAGQGDWSWNFLGTIDYSFNGSAIEWGIPRSALNAGSLIRLEFHVSGGDVTTETWAHQSEGSAKLYAMAPPPPRTLDVASLYGAPVPAVGRHTNALGSVLTNRVANPAPVNGTQYVAVGWTMTGNAPLSGAATNFVMTLTNNTALTWLWNTNVQFSVNSAGNGGVGGDVSGYYALGSSVTVSATPSGGYSFSGWSGDVPNGHELDNPLTLTLDRTRSVTANFSQNIGRHAIITLDGNLAEWLGADVFYNDAEISDGVPLSSTYSAISVVNDTTNLYIGLKLKAPSAIGSNWTHALYIDSDNNPNTGFNAGWMSRGYDRLIQYGAGGAVHSVYEFTGGNNQSAWSWNYLGALVYSYSGDVIEWAIPRAMLGAGNLMQLEFQVSGGDVTTETWAHQTEGDVKTYAFATPNNCPSGIAPLIAAVGDRTVEQGNLLTFDVRANDPGCVPPLLVIINKPAGATFTTNASGTNQIGTFSWTPTGADRGTHLLRFVATDDQGLKASFVMRVYVAGSGESLNSQGIPVSQTNWAVEVTDVAVPVSGTATVQWSAVTGIAYDIYTSRSPFGQGMSWTRVVNNHEAVGSVEAAPGSYSGRTNYIQVVPAGASPTLNGVWAVIEPGVPAGFTMQAPPVLLDGRFDGRLGEALANALTPNSDEVYLLDGGTWIVLHVDGSGVWRNTMNQPYVTPLARGRGMFILRNSGPTVYPIFSGPVGNTLNAVNTVQEGWNILGYSEGKRLPVSGMFEAAVQVSGSPRGSFDEDSADQIVVANPDGSWRRLIRLPNNTWFDFGTGGATSLQIQPGQGYYYYRQPGTGALEVHF